MRSGEAVQCSAKANANGMELVDLENVIGTIHAQGLTEGPFLAKPSARASGAWKVVVLGDKKLAGPPRVPVSRLAPASCEGSDPISCAPPCCEGQGGPWSSPAVF